jgi:hypothetical protein
MININYPKLNYSNNKEVTKPCDKVESLKNDIRELSEHQKEFIMIAKKWKEKL